MTSKRLHRYAAAAAVGALLVHAAPAAAGVPTFDAAATAEAARTAANSAQQLNRLTTMMTATQDMLSAVGSAGQGAAALSAPGFEGMSQGGDVGTALEGLPHNLCQIRGCPGGESPADLHVRDLASGVRFANEAFYNGAGGLSGAERRDYEAARQNAVREASISGYALALVSRDHLAGSASRAAELETVVNNAGNLREDVQANTAVLLAMHQQLAHLQAIEAAKLEIQAAQTIQTDPELVTVNGGTSVPQARNDADYSGPTGAVRTRVSTESRRTMQGSSGGGGARFLDAFSSRAGGDDLLGGIFSGASGGGASAGDSLSALMDVAKKAAYVSGNRDMQRAVGRLSSVTRAAESGDPQRVFWAGADAIGSMSGNADVRNMMRLAKKASRTSDPADVEHVMRVAESAARMSGNREAVDYIRGVRNTYRGGKTSPEQALQNAVGAAAQVSGAREVDDYLRSGSRLMGASNTEKAALDLSLDALKKASSKSGDRTMTRAINVAKDAARDIDWDAVRAERERAAAESRGSAVDGMPWKDGGGKSSDTQEVEGTPWKQGEQTAPNTPETFAPDAE